MGIYDNDVYGLGRYGPDVVVGPYPGSKTVLPVVDFAYLLPATAAQVINYTEVQVTWGEIDNASVSTVTEFRLLSNQWGFPVDENDGTILVDIVLADAPVPPAYNDASAKPGKINYYGIYMLVSDGTWVRSGFAACLVPTPYGMGDRLLTLMPEYFRSFGANQNTVPQPPVPVTPPAIPASGTKIVNPYGFDVNVYITGTLTGLIVNGLPIPPTSHFILIGNGSVTLNFPYPMWVSGSSYVTGNSVIYAGNSYICTANVTSATPPSSDGAHWSALALTPFPTWTPGLTWQSGQIVIYQGQYYQAIYQVVASTVAPSIDNSYWAAINVEPVTWEWTQVAPQQVDTFLEDYLNVIGFNLDFLKTQYDFELAGLNDPMKMSLSDLQDFCGEIGMPFSTELPAYTMRKAALFWARVMLERGTLGGIAEHVSLFSGYDVDLSLSRNILLDDDMSVPVDPPIPTWDAGTKYSIGDKVIYPVADTWNILSTYPVGAIVEYDGLLYEATVETQGVPPTVTADWSQTILGPFTYTCKLATVSLPGPSPSGSPTEIDPSHTWYPIYGSWDGGEYVVTFFDIPPFVGDAGTWENLRSDGSEYGIEIGIGFPDALTWNEATPGATSDPPNLDSRTYRAYNTTGSAEANAWVRSLGRAEDDIIDDTGNHAADAQVAVQHGTPTPRATPYSVSGTYSTGDVVESNGTFFVAQRGSAGAAPPVLGQPLNSNPYFTTGLSGWGSSATITPVTSPSLTGHAMHVTFAGTFAQVYSNIRVSVIPGATYVFTAYAYTTASSQQPSLSATTYDCFGNFINGYTTTPTAISTSTWTKYSLTIPADPSAYEMSFNLNDTTSGTCDIVWGSAVLTVTSTPEWSPVSLDNRMHVMMSAYTLADIGTAPTASTTVIPFSEFYDDWGNFIGRAFSRSFSSDYLFDSFGIGYLQPVPLRQLDAGGIPWTMPEGSLTVTPQQDIRATTASSESIAVVSVPASSMQAVTYTSGATTSLASGLVFWYSDNNNLWYTGETALYYRVSGVTHHGATYTGTTLSPGDRVYVYTNNATTTTTVPGTTETIVGPSIVVYKNQVAAADILVAMSASPGSGQIAFPSPAPYKPATTPGIMSNAGIIAEAPTA